MSEVYVVLYSAAYEGSELLGVFSDYVKAREFEVEYSGRYAISTDSDYEGIEIRKVELDKVYTGMFNVGEVL
jgi:hypothetical protein